MRLNTLSPAAGSKRVKHRPGRGIGSAPAWARLVVVVLKAKPLVPVAAKSATVSKAARCL